MARPSVVRRAASAPRRRAVIGRTVRLRLIRERGVGHVRGRTGRRTARTPPQGSMRFQDETTAPASPRSPSARRASRPNAANGRPQEQAEADAAAVAHAAQADPRRRRRHRRARRGHRGRLRDRPARRGGVRAQCVDDERRRRRRLQLRHPRRASSSYHGGGGFYPIFIGAGGRQYHYNYGGTGRSAARSPAAPPRCPGLRTHVTTASGHVGDGVGARAAAARCPRGGLGSSGGGSSSGG